MSIELICADSLDWMRQQKPKTAYLTIGSPPYPHKLKRYIGGKLRNIGTDDWVEWFSEVTVEAIRITQNVVIWVANGCVRDGLYEPACEGLIWNLHNKGIAVERPVIWHKNAPPNRKDWFGNDWEFCMAFRPNDSARYFDWESIGHEPKYKNGGRFRQRGANGERRLGNEYPQSKVARPRDVLRCLVGGGQMGSPLAHENEAPFPESLVEPFIKSCCPAGGIVLDPFCGSGTSGAVAVRHGRHFIGLDCRESQIELTKRRLAESEATA